MKLKNILIGAAMVLVVNVPGEAAEAEIPANSLGAIGTFAAYEKFRIFSEVCGELAPEHKPEFDAVMATFSERMTRISAEVLATEEFRTMRTQQVPRSLVNAFERDFDNSRAAYRERVSSIGCKGAHENFKSAPDAHWAAGISSALTELRETGKPFGVAPQN